MNPQIKASQIAKFLKLELHGKDVVIKKLTLLQDLSPNCFSYIREKTFENIFINIINKNPESLIICPSKYKDKINSSFILSENSYHDFSKVIKEFFNCPKPKIIMGKNCHIKPTSAIGGEGFSYQRNKNGINERITHIAGVKMGDNVNVGSWTAIDRGILTDTIINSNVKIDNLVHIAHNCEIGNGSIIAAGAILGGGVIIGKNCFIGLNATIKQRVKVGDNAVIGMGAVVIKDVPTKTIVVGNPAKSLTNHGK